MRAHFLVCATVWAVCTTAARAVDIDKLRPIGDVASVQRTENGVRLSCSDQSVVTIELLAPDLVRVRAAWHGPPSDEHTLAVAKTNWTTPKWELSERQGEVRVTAEGVEVSVSRSPLLITFREPHTEEVINADYRPMSFDSESPALGVMKRLGFEEHFFGLGEKAAPLDKRRGRYTMWNTDAYRYAAGTDPLYQSIPFYMGWENGKAYGIFYDNSYRSSFDFGNQSEEFATYTADGGPLTYYFFAGPSMKKILERYTELTGRMPLPPRWTLGHQQSRYTYYPASEVLKVAETYRRHDLPLEAIHLDINYMDGYRDFTWDPQRFPDPQKMISQLDHLGVKIVTIVDPGIKSQPKDGRYSAYNEGVKRDFLLKRSSGRTYVGKVWPGEAVFVDYTKPDAARWWGDQLRAYTQVGVAGIWTDMNEPSDFVDQTGATQTDVVFAGDGHPSPYAANRNLFALEMAKATYEGLERLRPEQRPYVITRAAFAGIQRYSTMWTGDNSATWESMALSLPMFESLGLSGESFLGADVGGFAGNTNAQLLTRWYEIGFLTPFFRNHAEMGTYDHEAWRFGPYYEDIIRKYLKLRYRLLPFLYSQLEESHRTGLPVIRPLLLNYQDDANLVNLDDEFMVGADLLAAPILRQDQEARSLYLPKGTWCDFWTRQCVEGGKRIRVEAPLDRVPLYVRGGAAIPLGPEMNWSTEKAVDPLTWAIYPNENGKASGYLYEDDGMSPAYKTGAFRRVAISVERSGEEYDVQLNRPEGEYRVPPRKVLLDIGGRAVVEAVDDGQERRARIR